MAKNLAHDVFMQHNLKGMLIFATSNILAQQP